MQLPAPNLSGSFVSAWLSSCCLRVVWRTFRWRRSRPSICPCSAHTAQKYSATRQQLGLCECALSRVSVLSYPCAGDMHISILVHAVLRFCCMCCFFAVRLVAFVSAPFWGCVQPTREASTSSSGVDGTQEALTVQYLASVGAAGDGIDEDRVAGALSTCNSFENPVLRCVKYVKSVGWAELVQECHLVHNVVLLLVSAASHYRAALLPVRPATVDTQHVGPHVTLHWMRLHSGGIRMCFAKSTKREPRNSWPTCATLSTSRPTSAIISRMTARKLPLWRCRSVLVTTGTMRRAMARCNSLGNHPCCCGHPKVVAVLTLLICLNCLRTRSSDRWSQSTQLNARKCGR